MSRPPYAGGQWPAPHAPGPSAASYHNASSPSTPRTAAYPALHQYQHSVPATAAGSPTGVATARSAATPSFGPSPGAYFTASQPAPYSQHASPTTGFGTWGGTSSGAGHDRAHSSYSAHAVGSSSTHSGGVHQAGMHHHHHHPPAPQASSTAVATTAALAATVAAQAVPPGVRRLQGLPDPKALTNIGTWHFPASTRKGKEKEQEQVPPTLSMAWWRVRAPAHSGEDLERFLSVVSLLSVLRYAEACLLELAERIKSCQAAGAAEASSQETAAAEDRFAQDFVTGRLAWYLSTDDSPEAEAMHQRWTGSKGPPSRVPLKRSRLDTIAEDQGNSPDQSLWLFAFAEDDELGLDICAQALPLAHQLAQSAALEDPGAEGCVAPGDRWHAAQLLSTRAELLGHLPFLEVEAYSPHGTCSALDRLRRDPLLSRAVDGALAQTALAWALHRQRGRRRAMPDCIDEAYQELIRCGKDSFLLVKVTADGGDSEGKMLDLFARQAPVGSVRVGAFLSAAVLQLAFHADPSAGLRKGCDLLACARAALKSGDQVMLMPFRQRAVFVHAWPHRPDGPANDSHTSAAEQQLQQAKDGMRRRLLEAGALGSQQVFSDIEEGRFYALRLDATAGEDATFLWPQTLCLRLREDMNLTSPTDEERPVESRAVFTPAALAESLERTKVTMDRLGASPGTPLDEPKQRSQERPTAAPPAIADAAVRVSSSPTLIAEDSPAGEAEEDSGDADLWGEDDDEEKLPSPPQIAVHTSSSPQQSSMVNRTSLPSDTDPVSAASADPFDQMLNDAFDGAHHGLMPPIGGSSAQAPNRPAFEGVDFVTDDDFDFFGGGPGSLGEVAPASVAPPAPSAEAAFARLSGDEETSLSSSIDGGLSIPDFAHGSVTHSSETTELQSVKTPAAQMDPAAAYGTDRPSPMGHDMQLGLDDVAKVDLTFDALQALNASLTEAQPLAIRSKYDGGKFSIPADAPPTPAAAIGGKSVTGRKLSKDAPASATADTSAAPLSKKRRTLAELFQRRQGPHHDALSDFATPDVSVAARSDGNASDSGSEEDDEVEDEDAQRLRQEELLRAAPFVFRDEPARPATKSTGSLASEDADSSALRHLLRHVSADGAQDGWSLRNDSKALLDQLHVPKAAFSVESRLRHSDLVLFEQPQLLLSNRASVVKIAPSAIPFWNRLQLGPLSGAKDLLCYALGWEGTSGHLQEIRHHLSSWRAKYEALGMGRFRLPDDPVITLTRSADAEKTGLLEHLSADAERWNDTIYSMSSRMGRGAQAKEHVVLWLTCGRVTLKRARLVAELEKGLTAALLRARPTQHSVTIAILSRTSPKNTEAIALYDHILRNSRAELPRQLHPIPEPLPSDYFVQCPTFALASSLERSSARFDLSWPLLKDAQSSVETLLHVCVGKRASGHYAIACMDGTAQTWDVHLVGLGANHRHEIAKVWLKLCEVVRKIAVRCTLMLCIMSSAEPFVIEDWRSIFAQQKNRLIDRIVFASVKIEHNQSLPVQEHVTQENARALSGKATIVDAADVQHAYIFAAGTAKPHACTAALTGILFCRRTGSRDAIREIRCDLLSVVCRSDATQSSDANADVGATWLRKMLCALNELGAVSRYRLGPDVTLPWHMAVVECMLQEQL